MGANTAGVVFWLLLLARSLPPLRDDPATLTLFVIPAVGLAVVALTLMHPLLLRQRTTAGRIGTFLGFFAGAALLLSAWVALQTAGPGVLLIGPPFTALFGAPMVLALLCLNRALGRWLCPRPAFALGPTAFRFGA